MPDSQKNVAIISIVLIILFIVFIAIAVFLAFQVAIVAYEITKSRVLQEAVTWIVSFIFVAIAIIIWFCISGLIGVALGIDDF